MMELCIKELEGVWFGVACEEEKIFATSFASSEERTLRDLLANIPFDSPFQRSEKIPSFAERVIITLKNIYDGKDAPQNFSLATRHLPEYKTRILEAARLIPPGYVTSYGALAKNTGGGPRAVGHVMASNPFAPIVPCHRVVGSDFSLVGYGGGLEAKLAFLKREKRGYASEKEISVNGKKLEVWPVEFVLRKNK
jgi:methylated-DNA-[protein]-cysteine S-methyltransferase